MLYAVVGTVVALLRSSLLQNVMHHHHAHQSLLPFEMCRPSGGGGEGAGNGAYGVVLSVPTDAQVLFPLFPDTTTSST
jgi:hypothetical protein